VAFYAYGAASSWAALWACLHSFSGSADDLGQIPSAGPGVALAPVDESEQILADAAPVRAIKEQ
jgi:hypothetical protein